MGEELTAEDLQAIESMDFSDVDDIELSQEDLQAIKSMDFSDVDDIELSQEDLQAIESMDFSDVDDIEPEVAQDTLEEQDPVSPIVAQEEVPVQEAQPIQQEPITAEEEVPAQAPSEPSQLSIPGPFELGPSPLELQQEGLDRTQEYIPETLEQFQQEREGRRMKAMEIKKQMVEKAKREIDEEDIAPVAEGEETLLSLVEKQVSDASTRLEENKKKAEAFQGQLATHLINQTMDEETKKAISQAYADINKEIETDVEYIADWRKESGDPYFGMSDEQRLEAIALKRVNDQFTKERLQLLDLYATFNKTEGKKVNFDALDKNQKTAGAETAADFDAYLEDMITRDYDKYINSIGKPRRELLEQFLNEEVYPYVRAQMAGYSPKGINRILGTEGDVPFTNVIPKSTEEGIDSTPEALRKNLTGMLVLTALIDKGVDPSSYFQDPVNRQEETEGFFDSAWQGTKEHGARTLGSLYTGLVKGGLKTVTIGETIGEVAPTEVIIGGELFQQANITDAVSNAFKKANIEMPAELKESLKVTPQDRIDQTLNVLSEMIPEFAVTRKLSAGAVSRLAKSSQTVDKLAKSMVALERLKNSANASTKAKLVSRALLGTAKAVEQGVTYQAAGTLFDAKEGDFSSGVAGSLAQQFVETFIPAGKALGPVAKELIRRFGGGLGETAEEIGQEIVQNGYKKFAQQMSNPEELAWFVGTTFALGAAMASAGDNTGSILMDYALEAKKGLPLELQKKFEDEVGLTEVKNVVEDELEPSIIEQLEGKTDDTKSFEEGKSYQAGDVVTFDEEVELTPEQEYEQVQARIKEIEDKYATTEQKEDTAGEAVQEDTGAVTEGEDVSVSADEETETTTEADTEVVADEEVDTEVTADEETETTTEADTEVVADEEVDTEVTADEEVEGQKQLTPEQEEEVNTLIDNIAQKEGRTPQEVEQVVKDYSEGKPLADDDKTLVFNNLNEVSEYAQQISPPVAPILAPPQVTIDEEVDTEVDTAVDTEVDTEVEAVEEVDTEGEAVVDTEEEVVAQELTPEQEEEINTLIDNIAKKEGKTPQEVEQIANDFTKQKELSTSEKELVFNNINEFNDYANKNSIDKEAGEVEKDGRKENTITEAKAKEQKEVEKKARIKLDEDLSSIEKEIDDSGDLTTEEKDTVKSATIKDGKVVSDEEAEIIKKKSSSKIAKAIDAIRKRIKTAIATFIISASVFGVVASGVVSPEVEALTNMVSYKLQDLGLLTPQEFQLVEKEYKIPQKKEITSPRGGKKKKVDVNTFFQIIGATLDATDKYNPFGTKSDSLMSYRSQWGNDNGFYYIVTPNKKDRGGSGTEVGAEYVYENVLGVGHFIIDANLKGEGNTLNFSVLKPDDYIPVYTKTDTVSNGTVVQLTYVKKKDLEKQGKATTNKKGESAFVFNSQKDRDTKFTPAPLMQWKVSEIDFDKKAKWGKSAVQATVDGRPTGIITTPGVSQDALSRFSGNAVVFIFEDKKGNTVVRDFAGSYNAIKKEIQHIKNEFGLKDNEITLGRYDAGSFSAKPKASVDGTISTKRWNSYNDKDGGAAMLIPKSQKQFEKTDTKQASKEQDKQAPTGPDLASVMGALAALRKKRKEGTITEDEEKDLQELEDLVIKLKKLEKSMIEGQPATKPKPKTKTSTTSGTKKQVAKSQADEAKARQAKQDKAQKQRNKEADKVLPSKTKGQKVVPDKADINAIKKAEKKVADTKLNNTDLNSIKSLKAKPNRSEAEQKKLNELLKKQEAHDTAVQALKEAKEKTQQNITKQAKKTATKASKKATIKGSGTLNLITGVTKASQKAVVNVKQELIRRIKEQDRLIKEGIKYKQKLESTVTKYLRDNNIKLDKAGQKKLTTALKNVRTEEDVEKAINQAIESSHKAEKKDVIDRINKLKKAAKEDLSQKARDVIEQFKEIVSEKNPTLRTKQKYIKALEAWGAIDKDGNIDEVKFAMMPSHLRKKINDALFKQKLSALDIEELKNIEEYLTQVIEESRSVLKKHKELEKKRIIKEQKEFEDQSSNLTSADRAESSKEARKVIKTEGGAKRGFIDFLNALSVSLKLDQGKNGAIKKYIYDRLTEGARNAAKIRQEAQAVMAKALKEFDWDDIKKLSDGFGERMTTKTKYKVATKKPFYAKNKQGEIVSNTPPTSSVSLSPAEEIQIYLHTLNPNNYISMLIEGLSFPGTPHQRFWLTKEQIAEIKEKVENDKLMSSIADAIMKVNNEVIGPKVAEVYKAINGKPLKMEENYVRKLVNTYAINRDKQLEPDWYADIHKPDYHSDANLENAGFVQERTGKPTPLILEDALTAVDYNMQVFSNWIGKVKAVRDAKNFLGTPGDNSTSNVIRSKFGQAYASYMSKYLKDVEGTSDKANAWYDRLVEWTRGNLSIQALGLNVFVMGYQTASAFMAIGFVPSSKIIAPWLLGLPTLGKSKSLVSIEEIERLSPIMYERFQGFFDKEAGELASSMGLSKRLMGEAKTERLISRQKIMNKTMSGIAKMDAVAIQTIWTAVRNDLANGKYKGKTVSEKEAFEKEWARISEEIVRRTQPTYAIEDRSGIARADNAIVKGLTMFATQRNKILNYAYQTKLETQSGQISKKQARQRVSGILTSTAIVSALMVGQQGLKQALMDDDDERKDKEFEYIPEVMKKFVENIIGVAYFTDLAMHVVKKSAGWKSYGPQNPAYKLFEDISKSFEGVTQGIMQDKDDKMLKGMDGLIDIIGGITKVPVSAPKRYLKDIFGYDWKEEAEKSMADDTYVPKEWRPGSQRRPAGTRRTGTTRRGTARSRGTRR